MKTIELLQKLRAMPVFTVNDLSRILGKSDKYVKVVAYRLCKQGLVKRIERGKYTVYDDAVEIASYITTPSYISFWTALRIYGLTEQLPSDAMVAVTKPKKEIDFGGTKRAFAKTRHFWAYGKMRYREFDIFIADKEKSVIDSMLSKNTPFEEAAKAILSGKLNYEKLVEYVRKTKNQSLAKRVGYLMEKNKVDANGLLGMVGTLYTRLDTSRKVKGKRDFRWKIIVNSDVDKI